MTPGLTRREAVGAVALGLAGASFRTFHGEPQEAGRSLSRINSRTIEIELRAAERELSLECLGGQPAKLWTFSDDLFPVIRASVGDRLIAVVHNDLPDPRQEISIHWHGIRLPNDQDGVPYLVQSPIAQNASFRYDFTLPDTGTFFFHTHCNTAEQLGRGLVGALLVEGDAPVPYAADHVLVVKDWPFDAETGEFGPFYTTRGAARAGTYGQIRAVNGLRSAQLQTPATRDCRLRIINADNTRILTLTLIGAEAAIIAIDGNGVAPFSFGTWELGPGMRLDLVVRAPAAGDVAELRDGDFVLARLNGEGEAEMASAFSPQRLRGGVIPAPEPFASHAHRIVFESVLPDELVSAYDALGVELGTLCTSEKIFWTFNGQSWPSGMGARMPRPLIEVKRDETLVLKIINRTLFHHPFHLHGHTFRVLRSKEFGRSGYFADTVLVHPKEELEITFAANNPGNWMMHCHVIEHQESGMMGYFSVT